MALQAPAQLALPPPAQAQPKARGRGRKGGGRKGGKGDKNCKGIPAAGEVWNFYDLLRAGNRYKALFHERNANNGICFSFQERNCEVPNPPRLHICTGCEGAQPCNDCHCLQARVNSIRTA